MVESENIQPTAVEMILLEVVLNTEGPFKSITLLTRVLNKWENALSLSLSLCLVSRRPSS